MSRRPSRSRPHNHRPRRKAAAAAPLDRSPFELSVERLSHDGRGIGSHGEKTIFVEGALPGEQVRAQLTASHSRFDEAVSRAILGPESPQRIAPVCPHYQRCGGCHLQHLDPEAQLQHKQTAVLEQMQRWGGLTPRRLLAPLQSPPTAYRQRARLSVWYDRDGRISLGFREAGSKQLVAIEQCPVLTPVLDSLLAPLQVWLQNLQAKRALAHLELIAAEAGPLLVVRHTQPLKADDIAALQALAQSRELDVWLQAEASGELRNLAAESGDPRLHYSLPEFDVRLGFHPGDFIQVNGAVNRQMVSQAVALLADTGTSAVLDLFCGIGNFTLPLARRFKRVVGIEGAEPMVERGRENAALHQLDNVDFIAVDLEKDVRPLARQLGKIDAVLLDPPRAGARGAMGLLEQLSPQRVVYVSCNPATLARDAKDLAAMGYSLDALGVMDMFPQTAHIEAMALFTR